MRTLGLYCGTFNPFHVGHFNIVVKAQDIFDDVFVMRGRNPEKPEDATAWKPPKILKGGSYTGLTTNLIQHYINSNVYKSVTLIRGIRNGNDYDYEMNQIETMRDMYPDLQVVLIPCDREFAHVSSTMVRSLLKLEPQMALNYIVS